MTPSQFIAALERLELDLPTGARQLGVTLRTMQRYASGDASIPEQTAKLLRYMEAAGRCDL